MMISVWTNHIAIFILIGAQMTEHMERQMRQKSGKIVAQTL